MSISNFTGIIIDLVIVLLLFFSFLGGLREGAVKHFFGLLAFVIALSLTGAFVAYVWGWFDFLHDHLWRDFLTFLLTMGIILIVLHLVFILPRSLLDKVWNGGLIWNVLGGIFSLVNTVLGFVLLVILLDMYPVLDWLSDLLGVSNIMNWLVSAFGPVIISLIHMTGPYL